MPRDYRTVGLVPVNRPDSVLVLLRHQLGWTQEELARWYGVSALTMSRWENGHQTPPPLVLRVAWALLGVNDPNYLLALLGPPTKEIPR